MVSRPVTPPPRTDLNTPGAPRLGAFDDDFVPYGPRKPGRLANHRTQQSSQELSPDLPKNNHRGTKKSSSNAQKDTESSSPSQFSTAKKRASSNSAVVGDSRKVSGALTAENTASAAEALGFTPKKNENKRPFYGPSTTYLAGDMLPTPVKTPQKSPKKASPAMNSVARTLFNQPDDPMPRGRSSHSSLGLDGYSGRDEGTVNIYTDWSARIPEVDNSPDNPFLGPGMATHDPFGDSVKDSNAMVTVRGVGEVPKKDLANRKDGFIAQFRGKLFFRTYAEAEKELEAHEARDMSKLPLSDELDATVPARFRGDTSDSALKPRLLFPTPEQIAVRQKKAQVTDEEEATTDLETTDPEDMEDVSAVADVPGKSQKDCSATPKSGKVNGPISPPTTARSTRNKRMEVDGSGPPSAPSTPSRRPTRSSKMDIDSSAGPADPVTPSPGRLRRGRVSPSDRWQRTKTISPVETRKREGGVITRSGGDLTKRRRSSRTAGN